MCLETREDEHWRSPEHPESIVCRRCIKQSATALEKDKDYSWRRPVA